MAGDVAFGGEAADTREKIMHATYAALKKHGYAGISISRLAEEADLSKSSFYHHFDGKDDILLSFAEYTIEEFNRGFDVESTGDPVEDLYAFLNILVAVHPTERDSRDSVERMGIWMELRSQGIHDSAYREQFTETTDRYIDQLTGIIEAGIEQGAFRPVDAEQTAIFLLTIVEGVFVTATTRTDDLRPVIWEAMEAYIDDHLISDAVRPVEGYQFGDTASSRDSRPSRWTSLRPTDDPYVPPDALEKNLREHDAGDGTE
ncbi:TetR/AcrR family transcriptional regulator [Haloarcula sediminis]|uniref:TetR/AcrR family transcriptional regulator n=1 Tax=Haloarcula sediminis TaxID=3111777 RepID=UPI002D79A643|nr:TetR/AcrR family transcriptional regulator [Haloarcula sp. CK38]